MWLLNILCFNVQERENSGGTSSGVVSSTVDGSDSNDGTQQSCLLTRIKTEDDFSPQSGAFSSKFGCLLRSIEVARWGSINIFEVTILLNNTDDIIFYNSTNNTDIVAKSHHRTGNNKFSLIPIS